MCPSKIPHNIKKTQNNMYNTNAILFNIEGKSILKKLLTILIFSHGNQNS